MAEFIISLSSNIDVVYKETIQGFQQLQGSPNPIAHRYSSYNLLFLGSVELHKACKEKTREKIGFEKNVFDKGIMTTFLASLAFRLKSTPKLPLVLHR